MQNKECQYCYQPFTARRSDNIYCSRYCKDRAWRKANPKRIRVLDKRYREKPGVKLRSAEYNKAWKKANSVRVRENSREYYSSGRGKAANERYFNTPKGKEALRKNWRIAGLRKRAAGKLDQNQIVSLLEQAKGVCYYCQKPLNETYHLDHRIPVSRGGKSTVENMVVSCPHCNRSKGARTDTEFITLLESDFNFPIPQREGPAA